MDKSFEYIFLPNDAQLKYIQNIFDIEKEIFNSITGRFLIKSEEDTNFTNIMKPEQGEIDFQRRNIN